MDDDLGRLLRARPGHFRFESGHHGDTWLDLELLCLRPERVAPLAAELARRIARLEVQAVCGPLVEGAFVALLVAAELRVSFAYAERAARGGGGEASFPFAYRVPPALRHELRGKRVAIVNDVVSAGSAVRGTYEDLQACGAEVVGVGTLMVLGDTAAAWAQERGVALETLAARPHRLWKPQECPVCAAGVALSAT
jgi:orotate phosphoribosyltransferase